MSDIEIKERDSSRY